MEGGKLGLDIFFGIISSSNHFSSRRASISSLDHVPQSVHTALTWKYTESSCIGNNLTATRNHWNILLWPVSSGNQISKETIDAAQFIEHTTAISEKAKWTQSDCTKLWRWGRKTFLRERTKKKSIHAYAKERMKGNFSKYFIWNSTSDYNSPPCARGSNKQIERPVKWHW